MRIKLLKIYEAHWDDDYYETAVRSSSPFEEVTEQEFQILQNYVLWMNNKKDFMGRERLVIIEERQVKADWTNIQAGAKAWLNEVKKLKEIEEQKRTIEEQRKKEKLLLKAEKDLEKKKKLLEKLKQEVGGE
jgi:hypothetical protein